MFIILILFIITSYIFTSPVDIPFIERDEDVAQNMTFQKSNMLLNARPESIEDTSNKTLIITKISELWDSLNHENISNTTVNTISIPRQVPGYSGYIVMVILLIIAFWCFCGIMCCLGCARICC